MKYGCAGKLFDNLHISFLKDFDAVALGEMTLNIQGE